MNHETGSQLEGKKLSQRAKTKTKNTVCRYSRIQKGKMNIIFLNIYTKTETQ